MPQAPNALPSRQSAVFPMRIALLANSGSGKGQGALVASFVANGLHEMGLGTQLVHIDRTQPTRTRDAARAALAKCHAAAVIGGDGTVNSMLNELLRAHVPMYHIPLGTENLFARALGTHFGTDYVSNMHQLAAWAQARRTQRLDLLELCESERASAQALGALMCSIGPDARVVQRLASVRKGPISHASYAHPVLAEAMSPYLPHLRVQVGSTQLANDEQGWLVIASLPTYARGFNPCRDAVATDGLLDVSFFPASSTLDMLLWFGRCLTRRQFETDSAMHGARTARAERVVVHARSPICAQVDGDVATLGFGQTKLVVRARPGVLPVLVGPGKHRPAL